MAFVGFDVSMNGFSKAQRLPPQEFLSTSIGVLHAKLGVKFQPKNSRLFPRESWPSCHVYLVINGGYLFLFTEEEDNYGYAFLVGDASKELEQRPRKYGSNYSSISLPFLNAVSLKLEFMDARTRGKWWTILNTLLNSEVDYNAIEEVAPEAFSKNLAFVVKAYPQYGGTEVEIRCYRSEGYEESPPPQDVQPNEHEASVDSNAARNMEEEKEEGETSSNESYYSAQNVVKRAEDFYHVFEHLHKQNPRHWLFDSRAASPPPLQDELQNIANGTPSSTRTSKNAAVQANIEEKEMKDLFDHLGLTSSSAHNLLHTIEVLSKKLSAVINQEPTSSSLPQIVPGSSAVNQASSLSQMKSNDQAAAGASRHQPPPIVKEVSAPKPPATQKSRSPTPRIPASQPAKRGRGKKTPQEVEVAHEPVQEKEGSQERRMTARQAAIAARKAEEAARRAEQEANAAAEAAKDGKASKKTPVPKKKPVDDPKKKPPAGSKNKN